MNIQILYFMSVLDLYIIVNYYMADFLGRKSRIVQVFINVCFWA